MSSPASRQRQRHRRRARERLWTAQTALADRENDLAAYQRVIGDMTTRRQRSPFGERTVELVTMCRDATWDDCARLRLVVTDLARAVEDLEPRPEATT